MGCFDFAQHDGSSHLGSPTIVSRTADWQLARAGWPADPLLRARVPACAPGCARTLAVILAGMDTSMRWRTAT
jgi:hypothetical protein